MITGDHDLHQTRWDIPDPLRMYTHFKLWPLRRSRHWMREVLYLQAQLAIYRWRRRKCYVTCAHLPSRRGDRKLSIAAVHESGYGTSRHSAAMRNLVIIGA
jgi:hypothetical protein